MITIKKVKNFVFTTSVLNKFCAQFLFFKLNYLILLDKDFNKVYQMCIDFSCYFRRAQNLGRLA